MEVKQRAEVIRRLRCAAGHLNAVIEMAESSQPCEQVLQQLYAVQSALREAGVRFILCQVQSSQAVILESLIPEQRVSELKRLQSLYPIFVQHFHHNCEVNRD